jgi:hypothetical protein
MKPLHVAALLLCLFFVPAVIVATLLQFVHR